MRLLIVGCGYVGSEVARISPPDWRTFATTRSSQRMQQLKQLRCEPIIASWHDEDTLKAIPSVDCILVAIPHRPEPGLDEGTHLVGLRNLLRHLPAGWRKFIYLSTTGVYGADPSDVADAGWTVDEDTEAAPTRIGPKIALQAERLLSEYLTAEQFVILRLAGIYGPGRIPLANKLRTGQPLSVPCHGFLNLAHVVDIARIIHLLFESQLERSCYVFSDGQPVQRAEFYQHLAQVWGLDQPVFEQPAPDDSRAQRATRKRVSPARIVAETEFEYQFPNYKVGLIDSCR